MSAAFGKLMRDAFRRGLPAPPVAGAPANGTDEVQQLAMAGTITGGSVILTFEGQSSVPIDFATLDNATASTAQNAVKAAIEGIFNFRGTVTVTRSGSAGARTFAVTFGGARGRRNVAQLGVINNLTGTNPALNPTTTTPGVNAAYVGIAPGGAVVIDTTNRKLYINGGTPDAPAWNIVTSA